MGEWKIIKEAEGVKTEVEAVPRPVPSCLNPNFR